MDDADFDAWIDGALAETIEAVAAMHLDSEDESDFEAAEDRPAEAPPIEDVKLDALKKEDYVVVARLRRVAHTAATLWKMSTPALAKEFTPLPREKAAVRDAQLARARFADDTPGLTLDKLRAMMRVAGMTCTTGISRGGIIDRLIESGPPPPPVVLDPDQAAVLARHTARRLLVHAGPGAGKTTTMCHLVKKLCGDPKLRVLVLAYNRAAEEILSARLKMLQAPRIPSTRVMDPAACGAAVMTFDKFGYRINLYCSQDGDEDAPLPEESYQQSLDRALARLLDPKRGFPRWDAVVVDESQDIRPTYAGIADALTLQTTDGQRPQLFAAGDPRQELYPGARWFSDLWAGAPAEEKTVLRYNHRSAPEVVAALNAFSRANFPALHVDQIATRPAGGSVTLHITEAKPNWHWDSTAKAASARALGERVGHLVAEGAPGACYAISPVTLGKFGLEAATCAARQVVAERRPGVLVYAGDSGDGDTACAGVYTIATSKKIKGTERKRVVVFGVDTDFTIAVDEPSLVKLVFVAISRAADELVLVLRQSAHAMLAGILKPVTAMTGGAALLVAPARARRRVTPTLPVAGTGGVAGSQGLCSSPAIPAKVMGTLEAPVLDLGAAHADEDFLGVYAEALVAHALGVKLADAVEVRPEKENRLRGFQREAGGAYVLRTAPSAVAALQAVVAQVAAAPGTAPYAHAALKYSCLIGRAWTVSERLQAGTAAPTRAAGLVAAWLRGVTDAGQAVAYLVRGTEQLVAVRAGPHGSADPGQVMYEVDLVLGATPVELKYVAALTDEHRRQAAIYASLRGAPRALLVNLRRGAAEGVAAAPRRLVTSVARATLVLREARSQAIGPLRAQTVAPPEGLTTGCVISLDTEYDEAGVTLEFSAVAVSLDDWSVLGVFDARHPGVVEDGSLEHKRTGGRPDVFTLTGLRNATGSAPAPAFSRAASEAFRRWCEPLPMLRTFAHWGGQEKALAGDGATIDVLHKVFRPWLHANGAAREKLTSLSDAAAQVMPLCAFMPHRAFEDAVAAMAVLVATTDFNTRL